MLTKNNGDHVPMAILLSIIALIFLSSPLIASIAFEIHTHLHLSSTVIGGLVLVLAVSLFFIRRKCKNAKR